MSLLSTDITKVKRLSLKEVKLPAPELRVEPITPIQVERPPSFEEIAYSRIVRSYPLVEDLVGRLELVSSKTGERIKRVELIEEYNPHPEPQEIDKPKLIALAERAIKGEYSYRKEGIVARIKEATNVSQERAEVGFNLMLQAGAIEQTINREFFFLGGSTPF
jgi:hypothetical protein